MPHTHDAELAVDHYFTAKNLPFAGDADPAAQAQVDAFWKELSVAKITASSKIRVAIKGVPKKGLTLPDKLDAVIIQLSIARTITAKEAAAYKREVNASDVVNLLNDAIHQLDSAPTMKRVDGIL